MSYIGVPANKIQVVDQGQEADLSTAVSISLTGANGIIVSAETASVYLSLDGSTASASNGVLSLLECPPLGLI
ncbi:hypothetical protein [Myxosarcina sp. GI1(2024)]